jgi:hypothetical protein
MSMRSPRQQQSERVSGLSAACVEALEGRRLLSATGAGTDVDLLASAPKAAVAAKAVRVIPDINARVFFEGRQLQRGQSIHFGTVILGSGPITKTVEFRPIQPPLPPVPVPNPTGTTPNAEVFTATLAVTEGTDAKPTLYTATVTFNPSRVGTFNGPVYFVTQIGTFLTFNVSAKVLPPPTVQVTKVDVLRAPVRNGLVKPTTGTASVQFVNPSAFAVSGSTEVQLFASKDMVLDSSDLLVGKQRMPLALAKNANRALLMNFNFPVVNQDEEYHLIAKATGDTVIDPTHSTAAEPVLRSLPRPTLNLTGVGTTGPAFSTAVRRDRVFVPVQNLGNLNAKGTRVDVELFVSPTLTADPATLVPLASYQNLPVTPRAGTQSFRAVTPRLPSSLPAGFTGSTYFILARITRFTVPRDLQAYDTSVVPTPYFAVR